MILDLYRVYKCTNYTIGKLYVNGRYFCDTLEDCDRDLNKNGVFDNGEKKVYGKTAIPYGTYEITLDVVSPKFSKYKQYDRIGGKLPRLLKVPNYDGVLIHIGNSEKDTDGCVLVGENKIKGHVVNSTSTFYRLYDEMLFAKRKGELISITIQK